MLFRAIFSLLASLRSPVASKRRITDKSEGKKNDRRSQERGARRLPIRFFDPKQRASYQGVLINGSNGGAFIETNITMPLLTKIRIEGPGMVFEAQVCRVHWLGPEERGECSGGMAVRLLERAEQFEDAAYEDENGAVLSIGSTNLVSA